MKPSTLLVARIAFVVACGFAMIKVCRSQETTTLQSFADPHSLGAPSPAVYPFLLDPTLYPDYTRRPTKVPTWETFDHKPQFVALRHLPDSSYTDQNIGKVCWPSLDVVKNPNLGPALDELKRRGYYLFDIGGYLPGSPPGQVRIPPETLRLMNDKLGDHFLGFDMGEQDGRYLFIMRGIQAPYLADRVGQSEQIYRYFSRIGDDLGDRMDTLMVYWYWPYPVKDGRIVLAGAETQNRVTSSTIQYAFLRGAGKQYGVHWFGDAATFSTWDYKSYDKDTDKNPLALIFGGPTGPTRGNSLSLLRRLLFTHYLYNSVIMSFEGAMYTDAWWSPNGQGPLSPLGIVQQDAVKFVDSNPQPGVMQTPVALLLDYYAGWVPARTLTTTYQVWGYLPYDAGDYLTHSVLDMIYPGYEDCSYYHDERGTICNTPYGELADVIHSDAATGILDQYGVVVAAGNLFTANAELRQKLDAYVSGGGCLVLTAENARRLWPEWQIGAPHRLAAGSVVDWDDGSHVSEPQSMDLCDASLPPGAKVLARCGPMPAVARLHLGSGQIFLLLSPFGINAEPMVTGDSLNPGQEKPLPQPYRLLAHVQRVLDSVFRSQRLFAVGDNLSYITCRKALGDYTVGVFNNSLHAQPLHLTSYCGRVRSVNELPIGRDMRTAAGYWPHDYQSNDGGVSDATHIAGGDVRLFSVQVDEHGLRVLPQIKPPPRPVGRFLSLRDIADIEEEIQRRPTFFEHFDGVKVDWTYLLHRDADQVKRDRVWIDRQKLKVMVDFSSGLDHFPDLTLYDLLPAPYAESMAEIENVFDKMKLLGATDAIIGTHMAPELGASAGQINTSFTNGLRSLCDQAKQRGLTLYLENRTDRQRGGVPEVLALINEVGADNLRFALNTSRTNVKAAIAQAGDRLGIVLACAPGKTVPSAQAPVSDGGVDLAALKALQVPVILDAVYGGSDEVFRDVKALWGDAAQTVPANP
jgi:hypothetical protein